MTIIDSGRYHLYVADYNGRKLDVQVNTLEELKDIFEKFVSSKYAFNIICFTCRDCKENKDISDQLDHDIIKRFSLFD